MNRHGRRAVAKNKRLVASLDGISGVAEKLEPFMAQLEELRIQLANATELVRLTHLENESLANALTTQRAVYLRLFAQGMGVSVDTVLSMAEEIQAQLTQGNTDGIENLRTTAIEEADNPSP